MTTKNAVLFALMLLFSLPILAQENKWQHQFGADVTTFVRNFVNFNGSASAFTPTAYPMQFKALKSYKAGDETRFKGLRLGLGNRISHATQNTATTKNKTTTIRSNIRVGLEYQRYINSRLIIFYGCDLTGGDNKVVNESEINTGFSSVKTKTINETGTIGAGLVGGLQFNFAKRFALGTELNYSFVGELQKSTATGNNLKVANWTVDLTLPNVLYFNVIF